MADSSKKNTVPLIVDHGDGTETHLDIPLSTIEDMIEYGVQNDQISGKTLITMMRHILRRSAGFRNLRMLSLYMVEDMMDIIRGKEGHSSTTNWPRLCQIKEALEKLNYKEEVDEEEEQTL